MNTHSGSANTTKKSVTRSYSYLFARALRLRIFSNERWNYSKAPEKIHTIVTREHSRYICECRLSAVFFYFYNVIVAWFLFLFFFFFLVLHRLQGIWWQLHFFIHSSTLFICLFTSLPTLSLTISMSIWIWICLCCERFVVINFWNTSCSQCASPWLPRWKSIIVRKMHGGR